MVNTWKTSYFQTDGIRVLFVLPQSWTDAFIPMTIEPRPRKIVRVMVGRLEMLSAHRQRNAEAAIASLASSDPAETRRAYRFLYDQGRYVEPIIRHVAKTSSDDRVRSLCRRLLLTDFVTDLRAAIHNVGDGKPISLDPLLLCAQLARLLRQVGQESEARSQAAAVQARSPPFPRPPARSWRARPRQPKSPRPHSKPREPTARPLTHTRSESRRPPEACPLNSLTPRFPASETGRIGRAYAACVVRSGQSAAIEKDLREQLARDSSSSNLPASRTPRMLLAFLLEFQGKQSLATAQWQSMVSSPAPLATETSPRATVAAGAGG